MNPSDDQTPVTIDDVLARIGDDIDDAALAEALSLDAAALDDALRARGIDPGPVAAGAAGLLDGSVATLASAETSDGRGNPGERPRARWPSPALIAPEGAPTGPSAPARVEASTSTPVRPPRPSRAPVWFATAASVALAGVLAANFYPQNPTDTAWEAASQAQRRSDDLASAPDAAPEAATRSATEVAPVAGEALAVLAEAAPAPDAARPAASAPGPRAPLAPEPVPLAQRQATPAPAAASVAPLVEAPAVDAARDERAAPRDASRSAASREAAPAAATAGVVQARAGQAAARAQIRATPAAKAPRAAQSQLAESQLAAAEPEARRLAHGDEAARVKSAVPRAVGRAPRAPLADAGALVGALREASDSEHDESVARAPGRRYAVTPGLSGALSRDYDERTVRFIRDRVVEAVGRPGLLAGGELFVERADSNRSVVHRMTLDTGKARFVWTPDAGWQRGAAGKAGE